MDNNMAFQLPVAPVKPDLPAVRRIESANGKTALAFSRLLDQKMTSQNNAGISGEKPMPGLETDNQEVLVNQGIAANYLFAVTVMQSVDATDILPANPVQLAGLQLSTLPRDAGMLYEIQPQNGFVTELHSAENKPVPSEAAAELPIPLAQNTVTVDAQLPLPGRNTTGASQSAAVPSVTPAQAELQAKLDSVVSTVANSLIPEIPVPAEVLPVAPTQPVQPVIFQPDLVKSLTKATVEAETAVKTDTAATAQTPQSPILEANELFLANQSVAPQTKQTQIAAKQPVDTEPAIVAPAQTLPQQFTQDDKDFLSQDNSLSANQGLTGLRGNAGKPAEPVFEVPQQAATNHQDIIQQIVDRARLYLRPANQSEMVLQLRPEHLGELTLKVSVDSGGVSATFHSNNPEVRQAIEASLPQLKQDLSQQGIKVDTVNVFSGSEQFFDNGQRFAQQQPAVPLRKNRRELLEAIESAEEVAVNPTDGVDYRI